MELVKNNELPPAKLWRKLFTNRKIKNLNIPLIECGLTQLSTLLWINMTLQEVTFKVQPNPLEKNNYIFETDFNKEQKVH